MSININERLAKLKEFDQAAAAADSEIESITKSLGWSVDLLRRVKTYFMYLIGLLTNLIFRNDQRRSVLTIPNTLYLKM